MATLHTTGFILPTRELQAAARASSDPGSPSLCPQIEMTSSPSHPLDSSLWDELDELSLPSSPSLRKAPDTPMDLDRWSKRGFSEDLALPPRQIRKPFRFLDLPAEVRNIVYEYALNSRMVVRPWRCPNPPCVHQWHFFARQKHQMIQQWLGPCLARASKQLRHEVLCLYYATNDFDWYWDPTCVSDGTHEYNLDESIEFLATRLEFLERNNLRMRSITIRSATYYLCDIRGPWSVKDLFNSVKVLGPLRRSMAHTGEAHPTLGQINFLKHGLEVGRSLFEIAGKLERKTLGNKKLLENEIRESLRVCDQTRSFLMSIEHREDDMWWQERASRSNRKEKRRVQNTIHGAERWNGVLRGRSAKEKGRST